MKCEYNQVKMDNGRLCESFRIITSKGDASGIFSDDRIWVHHIQGNGSVKGIMDILINKFSTNKVTFTPLINNNIKNSISGVIKICKANNPENPYGEDFEYMECEWGSKPQTKSSADDFPLQESLISADKIMFKD